MVKNRFTIRKFKFNKLKLKPGKVYTNCKKVVKTAFIATFLLGTLANVSREVYSEIQGDNKVVYIDYGIGSIILRHRDNRSPEHLYDDIQKRLVAIDGLDDMLSNSRNYTEAERKQMLLEVVDVIADEANLIVKGINLDSPLLDMTNSSGLYPGMNLSGISLQRNNILANSNYIKSPVFNKTLKLIIHEMIHAVEFQNLLMSDSLNDFEKSLFSFSNSFAQVNAHREDIHYYSSFIESQAHLVASKLMSDIYKELGTYSNVISTEFNEHSMLPKVDESTGTNENTTIFNMTMNRTIRSILGDFEKNYSLSEIPNSEEMMLKEIYLEGYKKHLEHYGIDYSDIDLKKTYYYRIFEYSIPQEVRQTSYGDFKVRNYKILDDDKEDVVEDEIIP